LGQAVLRTRYVELPKRQIGHSRQLGQCATNVVNFEQMSTPQSPDQESMNNEALLIRFPSATSSNEEPKTPARYLVLWADTESILNAAHASADCTEEVAFDPVCAETEETAKRVWIEAHSPGPPYGHDRICLGVFNPMELRKMAAYLESGAGEDDDREVDARGSDSDP
jgi:hypothetical protein